MRFGEKWAFLVAWVYCTLFLAVSCYAMLSHPYKILLTYNDYGERIWELPLFIVIWILVTFFLITCIRRRIEQ